MAAAAGVIQEFGMSARANGGTGAGAVGRGSHISDRLPTKFDCKLCGSTAEMTIRGNPHHYEWEFPLWNLKLSVDTNNKVSVVKKPGCFQEKPVYKLEQERGIKPRWLKLEFKSSRRFRWLTRQRDQIAAGGDATPVAAQPSVCKSKKRKKSKGDGSSIAEAEEEQR
jgi:hypothetical protein